MTKIPIHRGPSQRTFAPGPDTVPDGTLLAPDGSEVVAGSLVIPGKAGKWTADAAVYATRRFWYGLRYEAEA